MGKMAHVKRNERASNGTMTMSSIFKFHEIHSGLICTLHLNFPKNFILRKLLHFPIRFCRLLAALKRKPDNF